MNKTTAKAGAAVVTLTTALFALFLMIGYPFGEYLVCMFLPIGFIMLTCGFKAECSKDRKAAADTGMIFSAVYAVLVFLVYYAQNTTVMHEELNEQALRILDFRRGGLVFNYDLAGYGMMALSTFFTGLSIKAESQADKWLKRLMIIHGAFFLSCFFMPMTGMFVKANDGSTSSGGVIALLLWCAYFLPIGILAYRHFSSKR